MLSPLSFRLCRRLALCLALTALLATLAAPLQAAPLDRGTPLGPIAGLIDWIQGLLLGLGAGAEEPDGPAAAHLPGSACIDPNGVQVPCPATAVYEAPAAPRSKPADLRSEKLMR